MLLETEFILSTGPLPLGQDWDMARVFEGQDHYFYNYKRRKKCIKQTNISPYLVLKIGLRRFNYVTIRIENSLL